MGAQTSQAALGTRAGWLWRLRLGRADTRFDGYARGHPVGRSRYVGWGISNNRSGCGDPGDATVGVNAVADMRRVAGRRRFP